MTLFRTEGLTKHFGGIVALEDVDVEVDSGELVGLIGPNGAGKTTLFNCATGFLEPTEGSVYVGDEDVTGLSPEALAHRGVVRTFQTPRALATLSVRENLLVAAADHPGERTLPALLDTEEGRAFERSVRERADDLLERFDLLSATDQYAGRLSGGERKILELARGLMLEPDLFMLDEPYAGVDHETVREISGYVEELNDEGTTFLVIEHGLESLVRLVDRLVVLHDGEVLADGPTDAVVADERVVDVYTGSAVES